MATYYYLVCDKCHERTGATKSGNPDEGAARCLDSEYDMPTFVVRHRNCGSLRVISDSGPLGERGLSYGDFSAKA